MLDSFEKESRLQERRLARQRQMRLMEEAASGLPLRNDSNEEGGVNQDTEGTMEYEMPSSTPPIEDSIDSEDDLPSMYSGRDNAASSNLWGTTNKDLDDQKLKFVMGEDDTSSQYSSTSWRDRDRQRREHDESRELIMLASRRISGGGRTLEIQYGEDGGERRRYNKCPVWFMMHKRWIKSLGVLMAAIVMMIVFGVAISQKRKYVNHGNEPWPPTTGGISAGDSSSVEPTNSNPSEQSSGSEGSIAGEIDQNKLLRIKDRILEHQISHASTLEDSTSAQYKALQWIVRDDPRQLDVAQIDDEETGITGEQLDLEEALFERYALAVLWFATTDLDIVNNKRDESRPFQGRDNDGDKEELTASDIQWKQSTDWLSGRGFCEWHGIICHPDVTSLSPNSHFDKDFHVAILNLTDNNLHGMVPREVYMALSKIQALDLSMNELKGVIGREIGELIDLQDLFLQSNQFTGPIPTTIGELDSLYNLNISDNRIGGSIPTQIGKLRKLRDMSMFKNRIEGKIPDEIGDLPDLLALYLDSNELTGKIPKQISLLTSLVDLRLRANKLTGTIPTELGSLTNVETIYLDTNSGITGRIPTEFGNLAKATEIQLYQNSLTGTLPSELGLLDGLVYLYLDSNELSGTIPEDWGGMRNLEQLFLSGNKINGKIPVTIRGMEALQYFRASDNQLSGTIPSDMGKMLKMEYLYLEENDLDGPVPSELGELYRLKLMHLDGNNLSGEMPTEICKLKTNFFLSDLSATNNEEGFSCTCCAGQ